MRTDANSWTLHVETGPAPQIPKAPSRLVEVVAWLGRPQRGGCVFHLNCQKTKLSSIWQFQKYMAVAAGWAGLTCSWPWGHESVGCRQLGIETIPSRCCLKHMWVWEGGGGAHHIYQPWSGLDYRRFINRRFKQNTCRNKYGQGHYHVPLYNFDIYIYNQCMGRGLIMSHYT